MARVLIYSADRLLTELVRVALQGLGAEIRSAENYERFEQLAARMVFDLVLVVGVAPFWSGRELFRRVRPRPLHKPEIYVLAWHQADETVLGLLESGVDQYMTFPLNLARLRGKVITALER
ncbi:MAG: response regulator transcription factor [Alistipes sp.]|nr:response regulator transcription factor [Alistipes sp.]